jgi:hypothetical protein
MERGRKKKGNGCHRPQPGKDPHQGSDEDAQETGEKGQRLKGDLKTI